MIPLTEHSIRASFANASKKEVSDLALPARFDALEWEALDYLGWRDPKQGRRAYVAVPTAQADGEPGLIGILLRQAEASPRVRAQCAWCQDVTLPNDVVFYSAKKAGSAGRKGDTLGTLLCSQFECSRNVRTPPPPAYLGYDIEAARQGRMVMLRDRSAAFASAVASV